MSSSPARLGPRRRPRDPWQGLVCADWPALTAIVLAEHDETGLLDTLRHLLASDYPAARLQLMPVLDRASPALQAAVNAFAAGDAQRIRPLLRQHGRPGKAAALKDATLALESELFAVLDAADRPPRPLLRQLAAPFFDAEVGSVTARRTRPGPGVTAWRLAALQAEGGWPDDPLAETGALGWRLWLGGWRRVALAGAACPVAPAVVPPVAAPQWVGPLRRLVGAGVLAAGLARWNLR